MTASLAFRVQHVHLSQPRITFLKETFFHTILIIQILIFVQILLYRSLQNDLQSLFERKERNQKMVDKKKLNHLL